VRAGAESAIQCSCFLGAEAGVLQFGCFLFIFTLQFLSVLKIATHTIQQEAWQLWILFPLSFTVAIKEQISVYSIELIKIGLLHRKYKLN
jgi:hypothetical protein